MQLTQVSVCGHKDHQDVAQLTIVGQADADHDYAKDGEQIAQILYNGLPFNTMNVLMRRLIEMVHLEGVAEDVEQDIIQKLRRD